MLKVLPTLDQIITGPDVLQGLDARTLAALQLRAQSVSGAIAARLAHAILADKPSIQADPDDEMIEPEEAGALLHREKRWIYRNEHRLPFVRRISPKSVLCSKKGLLQWLAAQKS